MPLTRRPYTSFLLILVSAVSCAAAWLLYRGNFIPLVVTGILLISVGVLVWGVRTSYREEAAGRPLRSALNRNSRKLIHSLWLVAAGLLNVVVGMIWYFGLPDYDTSHNGSWYYAYQRTGRETGESEVEVRIRNGLREEFVSLVFVGRPCPGKACYQETIRQADQLRINKNP